MPNNTSGDTESLERFYQMFQCVAATVGLALYAKVLSKTRHWKVMEIFLGAFCALLFPFVRNLMSLSLSSEVDNLSTYLGQMAFAGLAARGMVIYFTRNSEDPAVALSISVTSILERVTLLLCISMLDEKNAAPSILKFCCILYALLAFGDLIHITSKVSRRDGRLAVGDPISLHLAIDAMIGFLFGTLLFGFPDLFIGILMPNFQPNDTCLIASKAVGCIVLSGSLLSFASLCFKNVEDALATLQARLVMYVPILLVAVKNYYADPKLRTYGHFILIIGVIGVLAMNAQCAVWQKKKKAK